ncbi:hypothetical protein PSP6_630016 [Paraburkholderia tropica]|nr:hypothetical protein PSP6_630016 [Paraburkholderia tropica]
MQLGLAILRPCKSLFVGISFLRRSHSCGTNCNDEVCEYRTRFLYATFTPARLKRNCIIGYFATVWYANTSSLHKTL